MLFLDSKFGVFNGKGMSGVDLIARVSFWGDLILFSVSTVCAF